jgi:hypothetical protein
VQFPAFYPYPGKEVKALKLFAQVTAPDPQD